MVTQKIIREKPEINSPDLKNGVKEFKANKEAIRHFSKKIDRGLEVSSKSLIKEVKI